jgi:uncharacterized membrane protein YccF (DUF307 family)
MQDNANSELPAPKRMLWNKGKLTGAKPQNPRHSSERSSQNPIVDLGKPQAPQIQERKSLIFLPRKNPRSNSSTATASSRRAPPLPKEVDPVLALLLNVLWILFGGLWMAVGWAIAGVLMAITIIGLPWTRAAFTIAAYTLLPFGQKAVSRDEYFGREDLGTGPLGLIGNIIWFVLAGWWLALGHVVTAILCAVTIVGIPFAWAHLKLAGIALWPIGKVIVPA